MAPRRRRSSGGKKGEAVTWLVVVVVGVSGFGGLLYVSTPASQLPPWLLVALALIVTVGLALVPYIDYDYHLKNLAVRLHLRPPPPRQSSPARPASSTKRVTSRRRPVITHKWDIGSISGNAIIGSERITSGPLISHAQTGDIVAPTIHFTAHAVSECRQRLSDFKDAVALSHGISRRTHQELLRELATLDDAMKKPSANDRPRVKNALDTIGGLVGVLANLLPAWNALRDAMAKLFGL